MSKTIVKDSGLRIILEKEGDGVIPRTGQIVSVHYTGMLEDGNIFDSSVQRNKPFEFPLGQGRVIKGWDEGFSELKVGSKATLIIPSELGYGKRGAPPRIPGDAVLVFEVELLEVK
jgi:peptidylprolyl isomerase